MKKISAALLALALLIGSAFLLAQSADQIEPNKLWALVIGISNYTHAEPLQFAASDAQAFAEFLASPRGGGFLSDHVLTLLEDRASRYEVLVQMESMQEQVQEGDVVYIFIAGHGYVTAKGLGYFVPSDGNLKVPAATCISFRDLKDLVELGLSQAQRRILITDMCNAGRIGPEKSELAQKIQNLINAELIKLTPGPGGSFLNLLASRPNEASWEDEKLGRGVFTHVLLEALNGKGLGPTQSVIGAQEVVRFVQEEVPKYTANQQHPVANSDFDPRLPLAFLDRPGPAPATVEPAIFLVIMNADQTTYTRVRWLDPKTKVTSVRQLPRETKPVEIGLATPGPLELHFYDDQNQSRAITVQLGHGRNVLDAPSGKISRRRPLAEPAQVASLSPVLPAPQPFRPLLQASLISQEAESTLLMRLDRGTEIYLDERYFGQSEGSERFLQLRGLAPGVHYLRLVPSPEREHRFRLKLFQGPQVLDLASGELKAIAQIQIPPDQISFPSGLTSGLSETYRRFLQALWDERLIQPQGNSAWDYYLQLQGSLSAPLRDALKDQLTVAMGNRAQRTILKYVRGGDIKWSAPVFQEGADLIDRVQQLFKTTPALESQERFFIGRARIEIGDFTQASNELQRAIELDADASHAFNALGLARWKQNLLNDAVGPLQQAISLSPLWTYPRYTLALIYLEQRRYQEAEQTFQAAAQLDSEDSTAYHGLGQLYFLTGRWEEAERQLQRAIELNPGNAYAHHTLAKLRQRQQRRSEAEQLLRLATRLEPEEPAFRLSLAELLQQLGRTQEAQGLFARMMTETPNHPEILQSYAVFLAGQNQPAEANRLFEQAMRISARDSNLRVRYGLFLRAQGRAGDAEREFKAALQIKRDNPFAHYNLAELYSTQNKIRDAEQALARAAEADPRYAAVPLLWARIRTAQARHQEALEQYRNALAFSIEAHQRQEIQEYIVETEEVLVAGKITSAKQKTDSRDYSAAWSIYAQALNEAPESRKLREAILQFQDEHSGEAELSRLPKTLLSDVLTSRFWAQQRQAEELWQTGQKTQALHAFTTALERPSRDEQRALTSTTFNLGNRNFSIHQIIYRWGTRLIAEKDYAGAQKLLDTAIERNIFGIVPEFAPLTVDSLMTPTDVPEPKHFRDFEVAHHPDRRAHELYAAAYAGLGNVDAVLGYLAALESVQPDVAARITVANVLCDSGNCNSGRQLLESAMKLLPDNRELKEALRRLP